MSDPLENIILPGPEEHRGKRGTYVGCDKGPPSYNVSELTPVHRQIIKALADNDMKVSEVARALFMHRNTILYNVARIKKITDKDPLNFFDLHDLVREVKEGSACKL